MAASTQLTFDIATTPRRPTLTDMGGASLVDRTDFPPDKNTMPYADQLNRCQDMGAAAGRTMPVCLLWVRIISNVPTFYASSAAGTLVSSGTFTIVANGTGITEITWPAGTFPAPLGEPAGWPTYTTAANNPSLAPSDVLTEFMTNGVRVRTYNSGGTLAWVTNFGVAIY